MVLHHKYYISMDQEQLREFVRALVSFLPFNLFDYVFFALFLLYVWEDAELGAFSGFIRLLTTVTAFIGGLILYSPISSLLTQYFTLTKGLSDAIAFLVVSFVLYITLFMFSPFVKPLILKHFPITQRVPKPINMVGGIVFGSLSFLFVASFVIALILSFPTSSFVKDQIRNSVSGRFLSVRTHMIETQVKKVFGGAIEETLNFLTIKPGSDTMVKLNFSAKKYTIDYNAEQEMLRLVNEERARVDQETLAFDESAAEVARAHAIDMVTRGYFSHYTPEGISPFDRLETAGIVYTVAGENLALAPDVQIAMDGFMKSPGHRANILHPDFQKVGIGVVDVGIFGKMFVQEFSD